MCFGSSGMFEQDDVENWVSITSTARGTMARRLLLNSRMGLRHDGTPARRRVPGLRRAGLGPPGLRRAQPAPPAVALGRRRSRRPPTRPAPPRVRPRPRRAMTPLALHRPATTSSAHQFLVEEAHLLDTMQFEAWFELLTDDVVYCMPVRVTAVKAIDEATRADHAPLRRGPVVVAQAGRPARSPGTRGRRTRSPACATTSPTSGPSPPTTPTPWPSSPRCCCSAAGATAPPDLLSAGRRDLLRRTDGGLRLARREIQADEAVLRTQNLAVFL